MNVRIVNRGWRDVAASILVLGWMLSACNPHQQPGFNVLYTRAATLVQEGKCLEAAPLLDSCLVIAPGNARLHLLNANCMLANSELDAATEELTLALQLASEDSCGLIKEILVLRGHVNRYRAHERNAFNDYRSVLFLSAGCPAVSRSDSLGSLINMAGTAIGFDPVLADSVATVLIRQFPNEIDGYLVHANFLMETGGLAEARASFDTILMRFEDSPSLALISYQRGLTCQSLGNLPAACADWRKARDLGLEMAQAKLDSFCAGK